MGYRRLTDDVCFHGCLDDGSVLGVAEDHLPSRCCPDCDLGPICRKEHSVGKLSLLCLDVVATTVLRDPT